MKYIQYLIIVTALLCSATAAQGQYYSFKQLTKAADVAYEAENFLQALDLYQRAIKQNDDTPAEVIYRAGESAMEVSSFTLANDYFQQYLEKDEKENEADALYQVARLEHQVGSYEKAIVSYDLYLSEYSDKDLNRTNEINQYRATAEWALNSEVEQSVESVQRLDDQINSPRSENGPVLFNDQLHYSSQRFPIPNDEHERLKSELLRGKDVIKLPGVKESQLVSNPAFNKAGTKMYFTICDYQGVFDVNCNIYSADLDEMKNATNLTKLPDHINVPGTTSTHPTIQEAGGMSKLIFSSNRPGGLGQNDIYTSDLSEDGSLSMAVNYKAINTSGNDVTPFYHNNTETLYFSSDARNGYGGYDIYKLSDEKPTEPQNLGSNINSSYNELYYTLANNQIQAHFTSNRPGSLFSEDRFETCCYDIYSAKPTRCVVDLEALTYDAKTREPLTGVNIRIVDKATGETFHNEMADASSSKIELPCNKNLQIIASKDGYDDLIMDLNDLLTAERNDAGQVSKSLYLTPNIIGLELSVFEEVGEAVLNGATVYLTDLTTNEQEEQENNPGNIFNFDLKPNRDYLIEINKNGFKEETIKFNSGEQKVTRRAILKYLDVVEKSIVSLENAIPVSLYFDNDSPSRGATNETSNMTYSQTYDSYYGQKEKFKGSYLALFSGSDISTASDEMEYLFENNIKAGFTKYDIFKKQLQIVLEAGQDVNLYLRGYASPLAKSDYNTALGKRRVDSIRKEFSSWNNGVFVKYLNSGQLKVTERSFGETTVPQGVSDDPNAPSMSIYSPGASKERRVEIDEIKIIR